MECYTCHNNMKCINDVVYDSTRIDWYKCPMCGSVAEVILHPQKAYPLQITWKREEKEK